MGRDPDRDGLSGYTEYLKAGPALEDVIGEFLSSPEFRARMMKQLVPPARLPDLTSLMPERYKPPTAETRRLYLARSDADIEDMERLIREHRYYDRFDIWSPVIETDKEAIAAVVRGLGARSCFEFGCFTGPVLSLLTSPASRWPVAMSVIMPLRSLIRIYAARCSTAT